MTCFLSLYSYFLSYLTRFPKISLTLIAIFVLLPGIFQLPLMDRDEPRFSHATIEMMDRGEWVVPYFNDEYRFDKPPLTYWWMRVHYTLFGKHEFAARLHSTISAWLIGLLTFGFGRRIGWSMERAWLAGAMWLCAFQVLIHGRMAVADMPLILCLMGSQWAQWELLRSSRGRGIFTKWFWIFHVTVGIGFLAKGPLAYIIPLLTLLLYGVLLHSRGRRRWGEEESKAWRKTLRSTMLGVPISLGIVALWGVPAMLQTENQYFEVGIGTHVVERATSAMNSRKVHYWIYLVYMFPFLLPWSAQLVRVIRSGFSKGERAEVRFYLIAWFMSSFLIFSFMKTQLPHYILPGYPAFMLLLAGLIGHKYQYTLMGRVLGIGLVAVALGLCLILFASAFLCPIDGEVAPMRGLFLSLSGLVLCLAFAAGVVYRNAPRSGEKAVMLVVSASLMMIPIGYYARSGHATVRLMPLLSKERATKRAAWGFQEGSLVWYPSDFWIFGDPSHNSEFEEADEMVFQVKRWRVDDDFLRDVMTGKVPSPVDNDTLEVEAYLKKFEVEEVGRVQGLNPGNTSWVELLVARRPLKVSL